MAPWAEIVIFITLAAVLVIVVELYIRYG